MQKLLLLCCVYLGLMSQSMAQTKYWIFFTDKDTTQYDYRLHLTEEAIEKRTLQEIPLLQYTDIPLKENYIQSIKNKQIKPIMQSKWLNAVSAILTENDKKKLDSLPFIRQIIPIYDRLKILSFKDTIEYHTALEQMEAYHFTKEKLNGDGVIVGVIDAGYVGASQNEYLEHLFNENRILGVKDLVNPQRTEHFKYSETSSDNHGNTVLQMVTGYEKGGMQYGFATKSRFYLARTDHGDREFRGEEDYWVAAMEWMDSLGVRIINTSLGYALGFDNPQENYKPEQMNGKTSIISKAAQIASDEKGLLIVVSAGNEGNDVNWGIISTPADAKGVLSVGANTFQYLKAGYSSIGAEFLDYLKPNVVCYASGGTSFAAPILTGFAACMMQKNPKSTNKQIIAYIEKSGHLYPHGNNYIGYGVPKASRILALMNGEKEQNNAKIEKAKGVYFFKNKSNGNIKAQIFHKKNATIVIEQEMRNFGQGENRIDKPNKATQTTLVLPDEVIEIFWDKTSAKVVKKAMRKAKRQAKKEAKQEAKKNK
jgi:hypothetical protein